MDSEACRLLEIIQEMRSILDEYRKEQSSIMSKGSLYTDLITLYANVGIWIDFPKKIDQETPKDYLKLRLYHHGVNAEMVRKGLVKCKKRDRFLKLFKEMIEILKR